MTDVQKIATTLTSIAMVLRGFAGDLYRVSIINRYDCDDLWKQIDSMIEDSEKILNKKSKTRRKHGRRKLQTGGDS